MLWLDIDTIVNGSLESLWALPMEDYYVAGVTDIISPRVEISKYHYINAGVLLMNLKAWRENHIDWYTTGLLNMNWFPYPDQDVMNYYCQNKIRYLPNTYNYGMATKGPKLEDPIIYHFAGGAKLKLWEPEARENPQNQLLWEKYYCTDLSHLIS